MSIKTAESRIPGTEKKDWVTPDIQLINVHKGKWANPDVELIDILGGTFILPEGSYPFGNPGVHGYLS